MIRFIALETIPHSEIRSWSWSLLLLLLLLGGAVVSLLLLLGWLAKGSPIRSLLVVSVIERGHSVARLCIPLVWPGIVSLLLLVLLLLLLLWLMLLLLGLLLDASLML